MVAGHRRLDDEQALSRSFRAPVPLREDDDMTIKFGWCLDGLHEACVAGYTIKVDVVAEGRGRKKAEQVEVESKCPCECHQ